MMNIQLPLTFLSDFKKPKIKGKNVFQIFKNFVKDYPRAQLEVFMRIAFQKSCLTTKDDARSATIRKMANETYSTSTDFAECLDLYGESLRYATYKSESYAIALANRSAVLFKLCEYEKCVQDVDLCLEAQYPRHLKPKVYLRKCNSFKNMRKREEMMKTAEEFVTFLGSFPRSTVEKHTLELCSILDSDTVTISETKDCMELPPIDENIEFPGASKNLELKEDQNGDYYVCSSAPIKKGQVLFVEKAYASSLSDQKNKYCQYCLKSIISGIPCRACVKNMYCNETCQNLAWNEFHQWECCGDQADLFDDSHEMLLAFRILLKAWQNNSIPPAKEDIPIDQYSSIYRLHPNLHNKEYLQTYAEKAMVFVNYLKEQTNFFEHLKSQPKFCDKSNNALMTNVGGNLIRFVSQVQSRALRLVDFTDLEINYLGSVAFLAVSKMSHSCDPNTIYYFYDDVVVVKALTDIDADTIVTFSHNQITYYNYTLKERRESLWNIFHFTCKCAACSSSLMHLEKLNAFICIQCREPAVVETTTLRETHYKCLECDNVFTMPEEIKFKIVLLDSLLNRFYTMKNIDSATRALKIGKTFLHPYHEFYQKLYEEMGNYYFLRNPVKALLTYQKLLELCDKKFDSRSIIGIFIQIGCCIKVLICLEIHDNVFFSDVFKTALGNVKAALEKATEFCSLFCPALLGIIKPLQLKYSSMELVRNICRTLPVEEEITESFADNNLS